MISVAMDKDRRDVIHEAPALADYMRRFLEAEGLTYDEWIRRFGRGLYLKRNQIILRMLRPLRPRRVFEFASAGGFLCKLLVEGLDSIEQYTCTNFETQVVDYCRRQLRNHLQCTVKTIDANVFRTTDIDHEGLHQYDAIVTTSLEHIEHDRELIAKFPAGCSFVFSVAGFDDPEHFRVFDTVDQISERYRDLLRIREVESVAAGKKLVVLSRRR
jgi:hypothetical protein